MPTANSYMDKINAAKFSIKAHGTLDLQRAREVKSSPSSPPDFEAKEPECNWRVALWMQSPKEP